jgi:hypothetical protein
MREVAVGGLPDRGMPPGRGIAEDGDAGLPMPPVKREIWDGCGGTSASFPNSLIWCTRTSYTAQPLFELRLVLRVARTNERANFLTFKQVDFTDKLV